MAADAARKLAMANPSSMICVPSTTTSQRGSDMTESSRASKEGEIRYGRPTNSLTYRLKTSTWRASSPTWLAATCLA